MPIFVCDYYTACASFFDCNIMKFAEKLRQLRKERKMTQAVAEAKEQYGSRGANDAIKLINQVSALFAGGDLDEDTKDEVMKALQNAYWQAKEINKKYTPKKYLREDE